MVCERLCSRCLPVLCDNCLFDVERHVCRFKCNLLFQIIFRRNHAVPCAFSGKECAFHGGVECFCINGDRAVLGKESHGKFLGGRARHGKVEEQVQGMHTVLQCPLRTHLADFFAAQIVGGCQNAVCAEILFCGIRFHGICLQLDFRKKIDLCGFRRNKSQTDNCFLTVGSHEDSGGVGVVVVVHLLCIECTAYPAESLVFGRLRPVYGWVAAISGNLIFPVICPRV